MSRLNCPNCGAVIEVNKNKCSYCGTSYYDLSAIDFTSNKPIYLKIKINDGIEITQKCIPILGAMNFESESVSISNGSRKIGSFTCGTTVSTDISFRSVPDNDGTLFKAEKVSR